MQTKTFLWKAGIRPCMDMQCNKHNQIADRAEKALARLCTSQ